MVRFTQNLLRRCTMRCRWRTTNRSKLKPEVEFQYGGRSFSETGSSYNSAVDWDIFTNFGILRDPDLLRTCALPIRNRKVIRAVNGRHLENFSDVITTSPMVWVTWHLVCRRKMRCWWIAEWDIFTKFGTLRHLGLLRTRAQPNRNRKLIRDVSGSHLENFNNVITLSPMVQFTNNRN